MKRKHGYTYDQYKELVERVWKLKETTLVTVDKACEMCEVDRKFYNYARQMLRRGKPMAELGF